MLIRRIRFPVAIRHRLFHKALHSSRPFRDHCADRPRSAPASAAFRHVDLQESDHKATAESGVLLGSRPSNRVSSTDCAKPGTASLFAANVASVHPELTRLLAKRNDVLLRADFRPGAHSILDRAVARGELTRLFPRTYVRTTRLTEPWVRWAAALRYAGNCAALSFVPGLQFWRLMPPRPGAVHITIGSDRQLRGGPPHPRFGQPRRADVGAGKQARQLAAGDSAVPNRVCAGAEVCTQEYVVPLRQQPG